MYSLKVPLRGSVRVHFQGHQGQFLSAVQGDGKKEKTENKSRVTLRPDSNR